MIYSRPHDSPWSLGKCIVGSQYIMIGDWSRPANRSKPLWKLGLLGRYEMLDGTLPTTGATVPLTAVVLSESIRPPVVLFTTIITTPQALNRNTHLRSFRFRYHIITQTYAPQLFAEDNGITHCTFNVRGE